MTNYEKIKAMSVDEMARFFDRLIQDCSECPAYKNGICYASFATKCDEKLKKWLLKEAEQ